MIQNNTANDTNYADQRTDIKCAHTNKANYEEGAWFTQCSDEFLHGGNNTHADNLGFRWSVC